VNTVVPRHVLFLVENASVPLDRRVWKEAMAVHDMGHAVTIVCPRGRHTDTEKQITLEGIDIHRYPHVVIGTGIISYCFEYLNALVWSNGKKYLLVYLGVMGEDDGVDVILKAAHYLITKKNFDDCYCAVVGPTEVDLSPAILRLQKLNADLKLESHVGFTGFLPWARVHQYLNTADLGLSPDLFTAQNNLSTMIKMMEYMSHGIPILSFNLKENRYSGGDAALYCDAFQVEEFAEKILMLLRHEGRRMQMKTRDLSVIGPTLTGQSHVMNSKRSMPVFTENGILW
jgi:glycosyltransferase involved in cell wall biosynthesis